MYLKLLRLELKNFIRNPQFGANLAMKILTAFGIAYFSLVFVALPFLLYFYAKNKLHADPLMLFCKFFVYYWAFDLVIRYFIQQMPTQNIKPFLTTGLTKKILVKYTIIKTLFNFFNWGNLLFLIPFAGLLIFDGGYSVISVLMFVVGIQVIFYFNNFLNILLNGKDSVVFGVFGIVIALGALDYFKIIQLSELSQTVFYSFYSLPGVFLIPVIFALGMMYLCYRFIFQNFYLDKGLELKKAEGKTENIEFLNRYGVMGTFINNDIRLLKRSKAAKSAVFASVLFLFYGLLLFSSPAYNTDYMKLFMGIFVTGGFMFMFGQRVPSWDSSYYPLMMTQNVPYKEYLKGKWALVVIAVFISIILGLVYILVSWDFYLTVLGAGLYNLGVNSYITLLAGAFNKKPIDLNTNAKSFGGGNNFNMKTMLLLIPQLLVPMAVFAGVKYFFGIYPAVASLGILGIIGFLMRDKIFDSIVKIYKTQKYSTLESFKKG